MDLEWNNTYCRRIGGFINEIIEIGAVKIDDKLNLIDTFSQLVRPQIGRKLQKRVKLLTNLTNEEIILLK
jgi:inhibitor of KinA sporulation pathway (predicted exonuclease)